MDVEYQLLVGTVTYGFLPTDVQAPDRATHIFNVKVNAQESIHGQVTAHTSSFFSDAGINPAWITQTDSHRGAILVCNEDHHNEGTARTLRLDRTTGSILNTESSSRSGAIAPAYACITQDGHYVLIAHYSTGRLTSLALNAEGKLSEQAISHLDFDDASNANALRQTAPHGHCIMQHPTRPQYIFAADLGADCIRTLSLDASGKLDVVTNTATPAGSGPRQLAFHPEGRYLYILYELTHEVAAWEINIPDGQLRLVCNIDIMAPDSKKSPPESPWVELSASAIRISPCGNFLYTTMRNDAGHPDGDCITVLRVSTSAHASQHLEIIQYARAAAGGWHLRDLAISKDGRFVATGSLAGRKEITIFERDSTTGQLTYSARCEIRDDRHALYGPSCLFWL